MSRYVLLIYAIAFWLYCKKIRLLGGIINFAFIRIPFGCQIGLGAKFGQGCILGYGGLGVVIHKHCEIGDYVTIGSNVTLGGAYNRLGVPIIGQNSIISTGAKLIGDIKIGKNCVIGANAVVLKDVPNNCVAAGAPARIIKRDINIRDYRTFPRTKKVSFE